MCQMFISFIAGIRGIFFLLKTVWLHQIKIFRFLEKISEFQDCLVSGFFLLRFSGLSGLKKRRNPGVRDSNA